MSLPAVRLEALRRALIDFGEVVVACSGGAGSMVLAAASHRFLGARARIIHIGLNDSESARLRAAASADGWDFTIVSLAETRRPQRFPALGQLSVVSRMSDAAICVGPAFTPSGGLRAAKLRSGGAETPLYDQRIAARDLPALATMLDLALV